MILVNAVGDACPIPVVKTRKAIASMTGPDTVETLVDNEIAVQNLTKMAQQLGYGVSSAKEAEGCYRVTMQVGQPKEEKEPVEEEAPVCVPDRRKKTVVVCSSRVMGTGDDKLGAVLMKGFLYAVGQQESLPSVMLFYNGGAFLTCEDSASLEDLRSLEAQGVQIMTCGTCLQHYGLQDKLAVGSVTNMYVIAETMTGADLVIKP